MSSTRQNISLRNSITIKLFIVGFLIFLLLIPTAMVMFLIKQREWARENAIQEVSYKWGATQTLAGPVLTVPYKEYLKIRENNEDKVIEQIHYAHFLPDVLNINGSVAPKILYRGIYEIVVYNTQLKFQGEFSSLNFQNLSNIKEVLWQDAFISLGIPDMRGIEKNIKIHWNDQDLEFNPGIETKDVIESGASVRVPIDPAAVTKIIYPFSFDIALNGSKQLQFIPLGKETNVQLNSNWNNPSFDGAFLPDQREVGKEGFKASWKIIHLNRNYPQCWLGKSQNIYSSSFGVNLLIPVNEYQKTMRSAKYAIMFIALTFLVFFFVEVLNKKRIHPIQYLLVGLALCIFYTLLLAISEYINFNFSYLVSSIATIALITAYSKSIFKNKFLTFLQGLILVVLYGFMYVTLQLQDYALLMGSIGLFIVLVIVMYLSRNIEWYSLSVNNPEEK